MTNDINNDPPPGHVRDHAGLCERLTRGVAGSLWTGFTTEQLAAWVEYEHEPDEDGERTHETLWDAVLVRVHTSIVASWQEHHPFLHDDPKDKDNAGSRW